jgi:hypothetical protein
MSTLEREIVIKKLLYKAKEAELNTKYQRSAILDRLDMIIITDLQKQKEIYSIRLKEIELEIELEIIHQRIALLEKELDNIKNIINVNDMNCYGAETPMEID